MREHVERTCVTCCILGPIHIDSRADTIIGADLSLDVCPPLVADITVLGRLLQRTIGVDVIFDKASPPGGIALA